VVREYAACFGTVPGQLFDEAPGTRAFEPDGFPARPVCHQVLQGERPLVSLTHDRGALIAIDCDLRFAIVRGNEQTKWRLLLQVPRAVKDVRPLVVSSRRFALVCLPWSSAFAVFALHGGNCAPAFFGGKAGLCDRAVGFSREEGPKLAPKTWVQEFTDNPCFKLGGQTGRRDINIGMIERLFSGCDP
jgi:hypothetical protein